MDSHMFTHINMPTLLYKHQSKCSHLLRALYTHIQLGGHINTHRNTKKSTNLTLTSVSEKSPSSRNPDTIYNFNLNPFPNLNLPRTVRNKFLASRLNLSSMSVPVVRGPASLQPPYLARLFQQGPLTFQHNASGEQWVLLSLPFISTPYPSNLKTQARMNLGDSTPAGDMWHYSTALR